MKQFVFSFDQSSTRVLSGYNILVIEVAEVMKIYNSFTISESKYI